VGVTTGHALGIHNDMPLASTACQSFGTGSLAKASVTLRADGASVLRIRLLSLP
jgi:hypothetical protein